MYLPLCNPEKKDYLTGPDVGNSALAPPKEISG